MGSLWERIRNLVLHEAAAVSKLQKVFLGLLRLFYHVGQKSWEDSVAQRAAALSFFTVLDLFPVLVLVLFGLGHSFLFREQVGAVRDFLVNQFVTPASKGLVEDLFETFSTHLDLLGSGFLGIAALVVLLVTGVFLLAAVEKALNDIWRTPRLKASFVARIALLWAALTLLPALLAGSVALTSQVSSVFLARIYPPLVQHGFSYLFTVACLWGLYAWVPQARVKALPSLAAALLAGALWEVAKVGMGWYVDYIFSRSFFSKVYGSLSLVPIGLVWIYYSWIIFLLGAECAFVFQKHRELHESARKRWLLGKGFVPLSFPVALALLREVAHRFDRSEGPAPLSDLISLLQLNPDEALRWVDSLEAEGILVRAPQDALTLAKPPASVSLAELSGHYKEAFLKPLLETRVAAKADRLLRGTLQPWSAGTLSDLLSKESPADPSEPG